MGVREDNSSKAVERALVILEAVAQKPGGMTNSEISRRLVIPKSTASYILHTLEHRGYLRRERASGKYRLGLKVLTLSRGVTSGLNLREAALPVLRHIVERSQLTAHLAVLDQGRAVYIEKVDAPGFIKMDTWVGRRLEVHTTAVGKALVSHLPEVEVEEIIKERGLKRHTPKTIVARSKFLRELEKVRSHGYAVDDEENSLGVRCIAGPVFNHKGAVVAAVGTSGTINQIDRSNISKVTDLVLEAARKISQQLGYQGHAN
jgi:IclR family transcriptional regulator, KDG regulon repressor